MIDRPNHDHIFGQDIVRAGERRTSIVIAITAGMMAVEIAAGLAFGSMALLADGLHMGSHAAALGISAVAYRYVRRYARDSRFSFGTGKANALAGFASGLVLLVFALVMAGESVERFFAPVDIAYGHAILVACAGLAVNAASVFVLGGHHERDGRRAPTEENPAGPAARGRTDHNLRAAYLHVLADAVTSLLAIAALLAGRYLGLAWMDPLMGIAGAALVARWSVGLLRTTGGILLDAQAPAAAQEAVRRAIEREPGTAVSDLHIWSIGPGIRAAAISVVSDRPKAPDHYRELLPKDLGLVHVTIEVHSSGA